MAAYADDGRLGDPNGWDYYGPKLPSRLRDLSVNGRVTVIGTAGGEPVLFLPAYTGIPDGASGFAHLAGPLGKGEFLDGFGDAVQPRIALGGGWWWVS